MSVLQGLAGTWNSRFNELESKLINLTQVPVAESTRIQDPTAAVQDTESAAGDAGTTRASSPDSHVTGQEFSGPQIAGPPIPPQKLETQELASVISGSDQSRTEKWNALTSAIKEFLPSLPATVPTPVKRKKLPDPADPEPRDPTVRMPLHEDITRACTLVMEDVHKAVAANKKAQVKPDRQAPSRFFRPEGAGHFMEPAEVEQSFKDLHQRHPLTAPYQASISEPDLIERERGLRAILCIRSARKWLDETVMRTVCTLEKQPGLEDWGKSLKELLTVSESLSVLELDRLIAEFANVMLQRREMWLRALNPAPHPPLLADLKAASLLTAGLFGDLPAGKVEAEKKRRVEEGFLDALSEKVKARPSSKQPHPEPKQPQDKSGPQPKHRGGHKKGQKGQQTPQPQQQSQQWRGGKGSKTSPAPAGK